MSRSDLEALLAWVERWIGGTPPANVWLGATVVNQKEADRDIPKLLTVPARVRFLSMEPLLGSVDISRWLEPQCDRGSVPGPYGGGVTCPRCDGERRSGGCPGLDWVIVGSESGPHARRDPAMVEWVRSLKDQCTHEGVAFLWKQDAERGRKIPTPELDGQKWVEFPR